MSDNTLHNTDDGTLLVEVLTNDALAGWLGGEFVGGDDQPMYRPRWADWVCTAAAVCSAIKCVEPNPACPACLAVVLTCVIMDFFNLW